MASYANLGRVPGKAAIFAITLILVSQGEGDGL